MSQRNEVSRRVLLAGAGAVAGSTMVGPAKAEPKAAASKSAVKIRPGDTRYENLLRGNNFRFAGQPDEIRVISSAEQVVAALTEAARSGRRVAARSGGHCFENLTTDPGVRMLLDLSPMDEVGYDADMRAFSVQPGATLGHVYRALFKGWGVTIPAGSCPSVGAGGHFAGGGYGALSRRYGSVVDHLYGVEVAVVDRDGTARVVVATREPDDPNRELWWAHTGGGGGNFGVVTRYWLRSPGATGDPSRLLPPSPQEMYEHVIALPWAGMRKEEFTRLVRNFGVWHERNSAPGSRSAGVYGILLLSHVSLGYFALSAQIDAGIEGAKDLVAEFVAAVTEGITVKPVHESKATLPWLHKMTWPGTGESGDANSRRYKNKAAYLRRSLTDQQLDVVHEHLNNPTGNPASTMLLIGYGGQVRAVASGATAVAQRDVVMKAVYATGWEHDTEDKARLAWVRDFYQEMYRDTGGVPVPGEVSDGAYINYADADLVDPALNTSGVPGHTLYYKDNYPRLQRVKARWDPRGLFRHALSIEPA